MKTRNIYLAIFILFSLFFSGCSKVLDMAPDGNMQMDEVLKDPLKVEALLNRCYTNIPEKGYRYFFHESLVVALSDDGYTSSESVSNVPAANLYQNNNSAERHFLRDDNEGTNESFNGGYWSRSWQQIRLASQFIEVIDVAAVQKESDRGRFRAEARLIRAFFYMELIKWFGKVPILDGTTPFDADFSTLFRASVYEVAKFVIADCDAALAESNLPWRNDNENDGMRMTKGVAHALRAKAILFAASPLHNEGENHWEEAYTIIKESVVALKANGYELFTETTQPSIFGTEAAAAFRQVVSQKADYSATPRDKETIFQVRGGSLDFIYGVGYIGSNLEGQAKTAVNPTQELVDAFETIDGETILDLKKPYLDEKHIQPNYNPANTLYDPNNPYVNRDPRFTQTVLYNGSTINYARNNVQVQTFVGGAHGVNFDITNIMYTRTGYYHQKMLQPGDDFNSRYGNSNFKYYRLAEILLDLAEASAEAGHLMDAHLAVNEVRARSGMPALPVSLSKEDLILRIRNERRVELAWEEQRYFDLRRWQSPQGDLSETSKWFTAMEITKNSDGSFTYRRRSISSNPRGGWENRDLLLPLPMTEAATLEAVTNQKWQNPGW